MANLTDIQLADLQRRGTNYLRILSVDWDNADECLSRAFLALCEVLEKHPEEKHEEIANNVWKKLIKQGAVSDFRQRVRSKVPRDFYDGNSPDTADLYEESHDEQAILDIAYDVLNDDEIIVALTLADNDLSMTKSAEYLGIGRPNFYNVVQKLRNKMRRRMPEYYTVKENSGTPSAFTNKYSDWNCFLTTVEAVLFNENEFSLRDESEISRLEGKAVPYRQRVAYGTVAGTTPTIRSMSVKDYESGM